MKDKNTEVSINENESYKLSGNISFIMKKMLWKTDSILLQSHAFLCMQTSHAFMFLHFLATEYMMYPFVKSWQLIKAW